MFCAPKMLEVFSGVFYLTHSVYIHKYFPDSIQRNPVVTRSKSKGVLRMFFYNVKKTVQDRLRIKINLTPNLSAMLTGHGRTGAYLHSFKLLDDATCVCGQGDQTTDHLLNHCTMIHTQREVLKKTYLKMETGQPVNRNS